MKKRPASVLLATALATCSLAGCSLGPLDLGSVGLGSLAVTTSVADARAAAREALVPAVADSELAQAGTLTVGVPSDETAPLAIAGADGSLGGIDVDVAHALADALGLASVRVVSVEGVAEGLEAGCDVVMGATQDDVTDAVSVQGSYVQSAVGVFASSGATAPISVDELAEKSVGVQAGSVSARALSKLDLTVTQEQFSNLNEAVKALDAGTLDFVACDAYSGAYLATVSEHAFFAGTLDTPVSVGVATRADASALQAAVGEALARISENGVVDVARGRWVGSLPMLTDATRVSGVAELEAASDGAEDPKAADAADGASAAADGADTTPAE